MIRRDTKIFAVASFSTNEKRREKDIYSCKETFIRRV